MTHTTCKSKPSLSAVLMFWSFSVNLQRKTRSNRHHLRRAVATQLIPFAFRLRLHYAVRRSLNH